MRQLSGLAGLIGILLMTAGCGAAILARYDALALDDPAEHTFPLGSSRQEVEARLGKPDTSRLLPDGSQADTYTYTIRNPEWHRMKWMAALGTVITVGFFEPFSVPFASYEVLTHQRTATFRYSPDDALLDHGLPPAYGPPDEGLSSLSFETIRKRCRSDTAEGPAAPAGSAAPPHGTYGYQACVVRRLAIWGIE